jgi:hypothetical protein
MHCTAAEALRLPRNEIELSAFNDDEVDKTIE